MRLTAGVAMMKEDKTYLLKRESEELAAAAQAHGKARAAHEEMAKLYHDRADAADREKAAGAPAQGA